MVRVHFARVWCAVLEKRLCVRGLRIDGNPNAVGFVRDTRSVWKLSLFTELTWINQFE